MLHLNEHQRLIGPVGDDTSMGRAARDVDGFSGSQLMLDAVQFDDGATADDEPVLPSPRMLLVAEAVAGLDLDPLSTLRVGSSSSTTYAPQGFSTRS